MPTLFFIPPLISEGNFLLAPCRFTRDMNSVMEIGEHIFYMYQGLKQWEGNNKEIIYSKDEKLNEFIFASEFLQDAKQMRMIDDKKDEQAMVR